MGVDKVGEVRVCPEAEAVHDDDKVLAEPFAQEKVDEGVERCGRLAEQGGGIAKS